METGTQSVQESQQLTFLIAEEEYAVGILRVREIIQFEKVTRVPKTPPWIRGVINLRGSIVPVVDLAVKFGLRETQVTSATCIVITEVEIGGEQTVMGLLADAVSQVIRLEPGEIETPPAFGATVQTDFLLGMGRAAGRLVLMLDVDKVLSTDELLVAADAAAEPPSGAGGVDDPAEESPEGDGGVTGERTA